MGASLSATEGEFPRTSLLAAVTEGASFSEHKKKNQLIMQGKLMWSTYLPHGTVPAYPPHPQEPPSLPQKESFPEPPLLFSDHLQRPR